jgi:RHS repeat-associated protein
VTINGQTTTTSYDAANQVSGWTYDAAGNLIGDGTTTSAYDALNRLTIRGTTTYTYNGDGALVYDGATRYTQDLLSPLSQILQTTQGLTTTDYLYGANRLASVAGSTRSWYLGDALGSVRQTLSNSGIALSNVNYDPWGTVESGTVPTFGFTGELQDSAAGLVYLRARWYSTAQGRFGSRDPFAGFPERPYSLHQYQYAYSNPVRYADPTGHLAIFVSGGWSQEPPTPSASPVFEMAADFVNDGIIPGETYGASATHYYTVVKATKLIINTYDKTCGKEPIILVGYSRGGATVQSIADITNIARPDVRINLVVTIAPVDAFAELEVPTTKQPNVLRHLNYLSGMMNAGISQSPEDKLIRPAAPIPFFPEFDVSGADVSKWMKNTSHFTVVDRDMLTYTPVIYLGDGPLKLEYEVEHHDPSPIWQEIRQAIQALSSSP